MPSRPVFAPTYSTGLPAPVALPKEDLIVADQAERESVNQWIERVGIVKCDFAADGGNAESVSVMRDAGHDSGQQRSVPSSMLRMIERAKAQTIQRGNRPRAHREDIAQDSADAGGGP